MSSRGNWTENSSIPFSNLNKCPLFWPKVHHFGHLSLEGGMVPRIKRLLKVRDTGVLASCEALRTSAKSGG